METIPIEKIQQKEFVYTTILKIIELEEGQTYYEVLNTKDSEPMSVGFNKARAVGYRKAIRKLLLEAIQNGQVQYSKNVDDLKELKRQSSICVSNWINRDNRLKRHSQPELYNEEGSVKRDEPLS